MANVLLRDLKEDDKEVLMKLAKHNKRSLNNEILVAIDKYIEGVKSNEGKDTKRENKNTKR